MTYVLVLGLAAIFVSVWITLTTPKVRDDEATLGFEEQR